MCDNKINIDLVHEWRTPIYMYKINKCVVGSKVHAIQSDLQKKEEGIVVKVPGFKVGFFPCIIYSGKLI